MSSKNKIQYVKPQVQDLGNVTPVYGGNCNPGSMNTIGDCTTGGVADTGQCTTTGSSAEGGLCSSGGNVTGGTR